MHRISEVDVHSAAVFSRLGQHIGDAPQTPGPGDTQFYGSGAAQFAGTAMLALVKARREVAPRS